MRIIGGEFKRRKLTTAGLQGARPSSDRTRESLFNILQNLDCLAGRQVLDLFAGSGALGLEALSRGAQRAVFVERRRGNAAVIRKNLQDLGLEERSQILAADVRVALKRLPQQSADLIFCDPPYALGATNTVMQLLSEYQIPKPAAILVSEHGRSEVPQATQDWKSIDQRHFGETLIDIFRFREIETEEQADAD